MIQSAVAAIRAGEVVGVPTDTVYGLGVDPFNTEAVGLLFELKGRPDHKPVGVLAASIAQVTEIADLGETAVRLAEEHWPGALTLVVRTKVVMADWVGDQVAETIGVRVPDHPLARDLLQQTGPMAVTSANLSGREETFDHEAARRLFGDEVAVYLEGRSPGGEASTVLDVTGNRPVVIRRGPVQIWSL